MDAVTEIFNFITNAEPVNEKNRIRREKQIRRRMEQLDGPLRSDQLAKLTELPANRRNAFSRKLTTQQ